MNQEKDHKGFTLVELIVVIGIMGILATIAMLSLGMFPREAGAVAHEHNVRVLMESAEIFRSENPNVVVDETNDRDLLSGYIDGWPEVPSGVTVGAGEPSPGEQYIVRIDSDGVVSVLPGVTE